MKTKILFIAMLLVIICMKSIYAESDSVNFKKSIVSRITYPEFAMKDQLSAEVRVKLIVNDDGKIFVDQINCVDVLFLDYVKSELQKLRFEKESDLIGKTFYYKFTFKYQQDS